MNYQLYRKPKGLIIHFKKITTFFLLAWCICAGSTKVFAQAQRPFINFNNLTTENGLSNNQVMAICQDSFGFIWAGTSNGLSRYDSKDEFTIYKSEDNIQGGLKNNNIRSLMVDTDNKIWVGTRLGGLSCFNQNTNVWTTYLNDAADPTSISNNEILDIYQDKKGRIWVGTEDGLNLFLPETKSIKSWTSNTNDTSALKSNAVLDIEEDHRGYIWVGLWDGGLHLMLNTESPNPEDYKFRRFHIEGNISANNVWKIFEDSKNRMWIGSHGGGLFNLQFPNQISNLENEQNWNYHCTPINKDINTSITTLAFDDIMEDKKGDLWIACTNGLYYLAGSQIPETINSDFNPSELIFHNYSYSSSNPKSIGSLRINKVLQSADGVIWVAALNGLSHFKNSEKQFEFHRISEAIQQNELTHNFAVIDDIIWSTAEKKGLLKYSIKDRTESLLRFPELGEVHYFSSLATTSSSKLIFAHDKGIIEYDTKSLHFKNYPAPTEILAQTNQLYSRSLLAASNDMVYIGTEFGLITLDRKTNIYTLHKKDKNNPSSLSDNSINDIFEDSNKNIWISTFNGLNKITGKDGDKLSFKKFKNNHIEGQVSLKSNQVITLEEIDKTLYVGTSNGFNMIDINTDLPSEKKEPSNSFLSTSFEKDPNNNLWYSSTSTINCYNTETGTIAKFDQKDGLTGSAFKLITSYASDDGYIYFGNQQGIARTNSNLKAEKTSAPRSYITKIKTISNEKEESIDVLHTKEIVLEANNYYLSINFVGLNYDRIEETKYAYMLEGLDEDWFYTDKNMPAVYTNLEPGNYTFKVKSANHLGVWNEENAVLSIEKEAKILETKWAQSILMFLGFLLIWYIIYVITNIEKRKTKRLKDFNTSLNSEIEERLKVEKSLLQTNQDLQQFAYSASHDLQEPLRNIGNAVGLLKRKNSFDDDSNEYVDIAVDGVRRMSSLIQNLLHYAKTDSTSIAIDETDLNHLISEKIKGLSTLIDEKKAIINIRDLPTINCQEDQLGVVFFNLISNALKFNNKEKPEVEIGVSGNGPQDKWLFYVKDNGLGIKPEYQNRIFAMFTRLENKRDYKGTGIGLTLCQKIVTRHNGTIWVSSMPKLGSTFFFTIDKNLQQLN